MVQFSTICFSFPFSFFFFFLGGGEEGEGGVHIRTSNVNLCTIYELKHAALDMLFSSPGTNVLGELMPYPRHRRCRRRRCRRRRQFQVKVSVY